MTKQELESIGDVDMYQFIEKGVRGGISHTTHRYAKANNKNLTNYNKKELDHYITYLDANNLYGLAISQHLPTDGF